MKRSLLTIIALAAASHLSVQAEQSTPNSPRCVATDESGNVYVVEGHAIRKYGPDHSSARDVVNDPNCVHGVTAIAVDKKKNVYFSTSENGGSNTVWIANFFEGSDCYVVAPFREKLFANPTGVAVDGERNVYVADNAQGTVTKFDLYGKQTNTVAQGLSPRSIAVDGKGTVYFTDALQIWKATPQAGSYKLKQFVTSGLKEPAEIAVDGSGNVYVSDKAQHAVLKYGPDGKLQAQVQDIENVKGIAAVSDKVYMTVGEQVLKLDPSSDGSFESADKYFQFRLSQINKQDKISGIAADRSGNIYLTAQLAGSILKYGPDGQKLSNVANGLKQPYGVAVDRIGNVYVTTSGDDSVWKATPNDVTRLIGEGLNQPRGIALDADGNIYVSDRENRAIKRYSPDTMQCTSVGTNNALPESVAAVGNGEAFFDGEQVHGTAVWKLAFDGDSNWSVQLFGQIAPNRRGIAVDSNRSLYIGAGTAIQKLGRDGNRLPDVATGLTDASFVATDDCGSIYFVSSVGDAQTLWKFSPLKVFLK